MLEFSASIYADLDKNMISSMLDDPRVVGILYFTDGGIFLISSTKFECKGNDSRNAFIINLLITISVIPWSADIK